MVSSSSLIKQEDDYGIAIKRSKSRLWYCSVEVENKEFVIFQHYTDIIYSARTGTGDNARRLEINTRYLYISCVKVEEEEIVELLSVRIASEVHRMDSTNILRNIDGRR